jgi:hypothetical protein
MVRVNAHSAAKAPIYAWVVTGVCFWMAVLAWGSVFYGK